MVGYQKKEAVCHGIDDDFASSRNATKVGTKNKAIKLQANVTNTRT